LGSQFGRLQCGDAPPIGLLAVTTPPANRCARALATFGWIGAWLATAAAIHLAIPTRYAGYDASWAAVWGRQAAQGSTPSFDAPFAPTPHPLVTAVATVIEGAGDFTAVAPWISQAALAAAIVVIAATAGRLFGLLAGLVAGLLVGTRPELLASAGYASTDPWFLALVSGAGLLLVSRTPRVASAMVLLLVGGLLRPEAWLLSFVLAAWWLPRERGRRRAVLVALAVSAPVFWASVDLALTGDPLFSFHGTTQLAEQLDRPRSLGAALRALPADLRGYFGFVPLIIGLAGAAAFALTDVDRVRIPLAAGALGMLVFAGFGAVGLPVLDRYLLIPIGVLAIFCGAAAGAWRQGPRTDEKALPALAVGVLALVLLVGSVPGALSELRRIDHRSARRASAQASLTDLLERPDVRRAARAAPMVSVPDYRAVPIAILATAVPATAVSVTQHLPTGGRPEISVTFVSPRAAEAFGPSIGAAPPPGAPALIAPSTARNRYWAVTVHR
jgi:hypothetical protein